MIIDKEIKRTITLAGQNEISVVGQCVQLVTFLFAQGWARMPDGDDLSFNTLVELDLQFTDELGDEMWFETPLFDSPIPVLQHDDDWSKIETYLQRYQAWVDR